MLSPGKNNLQHEIMAESALPWIYMCISMYDKITSLLTTDWHLCITMRSTNYSFWNTLFHSLWGVHDFTHSFYIHYWICQLVDFDYGLMTLVCLPGVVWLLCLRLILLYHICYVPCVRSMYKLLIVTHNAYSIANQHNEWWKRQTYWTTIMQFYIYIINMQNQRFSIDSLTVIRYYTNEI